MRDGDDVLAAFDEQCDSANRSRELCDIFGLVDLMQKVVNSY